LFFRLLLLLLLRLWLLLLLLLPLLRRAPLVVRCLLTAAWSIAFTAAVSMPAVLPFLP
jgi:hypothetical protein